MSKRNITELNSNNNNNITINELHSPNKNHIEIDNNANLKNNNFITTNINDSNLDSSTEYQNEITDEDLIRSTKKLKIIKICNLDIDKTCFDLHLRIVKVHIGTYIFILNKIKLFE